MIQRCSLFAMWERLSPIKKMGQIREISDLSQEVNWLGLEPRAHTLKVYCSTN